MWAKFLGKSFAKRDFSRDETHMTRKIAVALKNVPRDKMRGCTHAILLKCCKPITKWERFIEMF